MKRWLTMAGVVGLLMTALAAPGVQAASKTLYVGTCKEASPYITIQSAVDAVNNDGFTIYVCPGTYTENVIVANKKQLTIRNYVVKNQPAPLIDAGGRIYDGFDVRDSKEVEIRGLRITRASIGILAWNSPETEVRNTIITTSNAGIVFERGSDKSEAQLNTLSGVGQSYGIALFSNTSVIIKQNTITSFANGVYAGGADKAKIESNSSANVDSVGIFLIQATRASVRKNTTTFSNYGIYLSNTTTSTISDNTAKSNGNAGVFVESNSSANTFKKNLLQNNSTDAIDQSTGSQTAGTANIWSSNKCDTSIPGNLCSSPATQRRAP